MLEEIQDKILKSVLSTKMDNLDFIKKYNDIEPEERLFVYRSTILENFVNSLKIIYPGIWKLLGEDCARGVSLAYIHDLANIPSAGKMSEFGENFPDYLKIFPSTCHLTYLPDVARLELLKSLSFDSPNEELLNLNDFVKNTNNFLEKCNIIFNSSVFFMKSDFPLSKIQNLLDNEDSPEFYLDKEKTYIIIYRFENYVNTAWLDEPNWCFLSLLFDGNNLGDALAICERLKLKVDLEEIFKFIFSRKMIKQIELNL